MLEETPMTHQADRLEKQTLALFKLAYRQGRVDVAEYFLQALEAMEREPSAQEHAMCRCALMEAYHEVARRH
jgi:hypothetical protein